MTEWDLVWFIPFRFLIVFSFAMAYVIGGRGSKWVRRIIGTGLFISLCLVLSSILDSFSWWLPLAFSPLAVGVFMGYGAPDNDDFKKLQRRAIYGFMLGISGLLIGVTTGHLILGSSQLVLSVSASTLLGLTNPTKAVNEEFLIATFSTILIPFML